MGITSGITFIRYAQSQEVGKPNNLKSLGARKPKGEPKQYGQYQLWSPMSERGEPYF